MGVDSSTQSTKVEVRDLDSGEVVATGRAAHPAAQPPSSEQDPDAWWAALRAAIADAGTPAVAALSVAAQQHGLVLCDAAGAVLRPAKLWNDTTSASQAADMVAELGAKDWARATGSVPTAAFTVSKLAWVAHHEPEVLGRVATVALPHDHLNHRLTGRLATDRGDASGTGYFDPVGGVWRTDLLDRFVGPGPWTDRLPEVLTPTEVVGEVTAAARRDLGLVGPVLVGPGTGDNMGAALGLGLRPGQVAVSLGTSGTVFGVSDEASADPTGAVAGFASADGRHLPLVCTLNATKVTDAIGRLLGVDNAGLAELAVHGSGGTAGLVLVPHLDGERTPNRPDASGSLLGIRSDVSREQLARAAFEGVVCGLLEGMDALGTQLADGDGTLFVIGGGARSPVYRQVLADLSGRPVLEPDQDELVATGACVQAAAVLAGCSIEQIAVSWGLGAGYRTSADPAVDGAGIRTAFRAALDATGAF